MVNAIKAGEKSSIKVPEGVPDWKHALWRRVWRASFLVLQDEKLANKIANSVTSPDSVKESFIAIPSDVPEKKQKIWAKTYQSTKDVCNDPQIAKSVAYQVSGKKADPETVRDVLMKSSDKVFPENMQKRKKSVRKSKKSSDISHGSGNVSAAGVLIEKPSGSFTVSKNPPRWAMKNSEVPEEYQGWVEGYLISWGSTKDTDLQGEYFTPNTNLCLEWFKERPVLYHHGMDSSTGLKSIGTFKTVKTDPIGLWVQAQLDLRDRYARAVYDMVKTTQFGWSSGSVDHLVKISESGEILVWPLIEGSITPTPAQPAKTAVRPIKGYQAVEEDAITLDAFKAVLTSNRTYSDYLRGLDEKLRYEYENEADQDRVDNKVRDGSTKSANRYRNNTMKRYSDSAWYITRAVAKAFGIKDVTEDELSAIAGEINDTVEDEVTVAAVKALENEAAQSESAVSMMGDTDERYQNRHTIKSNEDTMSKYNSYSARRSAFRQVDLAQAAADEVEAAMADEIAATMADEEIEAQAARAMRSRAWRRAIRQIAESPDGKVELGDLASENARPLAADTLPGGKGYGRRQYMAADDSMMQDLETTMQDPEAATMGDEVVAGVATASFRRGFQSGLRSAYRQLEQNVDVKSEEAAAVQAEEDLVASKTSDGDVVDEAVRAYRLGYRRGLKRAIRQIEEEAKADDVVPTKRHAYRGNDLPVQPAPTATEYAAAPTGYEPLPEQQELDENTKRWMRQNAARNYQAYRQAVPTTMQDPTVPAAMQDPQAAVQQDLMLAKFYSNRARARRQYMADPMATMQDPTAPAAMQDPLATMDDPMAAMQDPTIQQDLMLAKFYQNRARRQYMADPAVPATMQDPTVPAAMQDPMAAVAQDEVLAKFYRNRARRQYMADATVPAAMQDPLAAMDDPMAAMDDPMAAMDDPMAMAADTIMTDEGVPMSKFYRSNPQAYRSTDINNAYKQAAYWKNVALDLQNSEAPGQRSFKSLNVRDVADQSGAYENAFKSYLVKGLGLMTDTQKYVLQNRGKARWENTTFAYESATKSVKTYNSSSDASVGFLVPEDWVNELNTNIMTQTVMAPECRTRTTTSDRIVQPNLITTDARRAHAAQVKWPGESPSSNTEHRTTEDQYSQINIPIHVMLISLAATSSALEDSTFNLEEEINEAFAEAVAVSYDQLIWGGDGQAKMQGIVVNNQVVGARSTGIQSVGGYIPSGSTDGIVTADVLKTMLFHLPQGYRTRAKWFMNSNVGLEIATLKDGEGNYLIDQRDESLRSVGIPDRLLGKPIVYNEWASDIASDSFPIVLADLSRGYVIGRRVEFSIRRFDDSNYAEHDQVLFLGRARLGGQVLQPAAFKTLKIALS